MTKIFLCSLAASGLAFAQAQNPAQQTLASVVRLNRAPVSPEPLKFKLARPVERKLTNGARLLIVENHRSPSISFRMAIPSGSLRDPEGMPGVSETTAAMMRMGTKDHSAKEIADTLTALGSQISFVSGQGETGIAVTSLTENFDATLALLADMLLNPAFPEAELDRWKSRMIGNLDRIQGQPDYLAGDEVSKVLYGADARQYIHPTRDALNQITREMVLDHYKKYYLPSGELAGIAGDITADLAVAKLNKALGAWKGGPVPPVTLPNLPPIAEKKIYLLAKPNVQQTLVVVANHAVDRTSPDYIASLVMNRILGSGPTSRLVRLREEKDHPFNITSNLSGGRYYNHFSSGTSVRVELTEPALTEILRQCSDIRNKPVSAEELADAKSELVAAFALGLETTSGTLARWLEQREDGFPEDYWDTFAQKVMAVSAEDVQRVAKKYVPVDNAQIIVVGDVNISVMLQKFAPVEIIKVE